METTSAGEASYGELDDMCYRIVEFKKFMLKRTDYGNVSDWGVLLGIVSLSDLNVTEPPNAL